MNGEEARIRLARTQLSTAALSDTLDRLGLLHQLMSSRIRPLDERLVLCGRARTGGYREIDPGTSKDDTYRDALAFVDNLRRDEVPVLACGDSHRVMPWGELFSEASVARGAAGCITDGLVRDVRHVRDLGFPVFSIGYGAMQTRGRAKLVTVDKAVHCGGVWVSPGDLVFGDADGVVVIPRETEEEVLRLAAERAAQERQTVQALCEGQSIKEVYRRFGSV